MNTASKITEAGILHENGITWMLLTPAKLILVDMPFYPDLRLLKKQVTILGTMGVPHSSTFEKLIAEKIILHQSIAARAYEKYLSNNDASDEENWLDAEKELLVG